MTAAADRTSAAIADAEDAGAGAVDAAAVEDAHRKAAAIFLLQNMLLRRAINARAILAEDTIRAARSRALSSRATIAGRKARASARLALR